MSAGRKTKPAELRRREATGRRKTSTVSKRAVPETVIVGSREIDVSAPADLPEYGGEFWKRTVSMLVDAGIVGEVDVPALRIMAVQVARVELSRNALAIAEDVEDDEALDRRVKTTKKMLETLLSRLERLVAAGADVAPSDLNAIGKLEVTLSNLTEYRRLRRETKGMVALGSTGQIVEHPLLAVERASAALVLRYFEQFALTPSSRTKLAVAGLQGKSIAKDLDDELGPTKARRRQKQLPPGDVIDGEVA